MPTPAPYDVTIPEPTDERTIALRKRVAELSAEDPARFIEVVRDAHRRELAGTDPIDALQEALSTDHSS